MKAPKDFKNEVFLDPKTPDFIDGVLVDFARSFFGMAHLSMVDPMDIPAACDLKKGAARALGLNPREAIESIPQKHSSTQTHLPIPLVEPQNFRQGNRATSNPREELISSSSNANPGFFKQGLENPSLLQEPTSLFDIFMGHNSPFNIFQDMPITGKGKEDLDTFFDRFEKSFPSGEHNGTSNSWSTSISIYTSPDGVKTTRKTVRHSDGSEEVTETVAHPSNSFLQLKENDSLTQSQFHTKSTGSTNFLDSISNWWRRVST